MAKMGAALHEWVELTVAKMVGTGVIDTVTKWVELTMAKMGGALHDHPCQM